MVSRISKGIVKTINALHPSKNPTSASSFSTEGAGTAMTGGLPSEKNMRKMDDKTFYQLFTSGDVATLMSNGGHDLTKEQIALVKKLAKQQSDDNMLQRQMQMATKKGYKESILTPLMAKMIAGSTGGQKSTSSNQKNDVPSNVQEKDVLTGPQKTSPVTQKNISKILKTINNSIDKNSVPEGANAEQILGGIYKLMVKIQVDDKLRWEMAKNQAEQKEIRTEKKHKEIIEALTILNFGKRKKMVSKKKKATEPSELSTGGKPKPAAKTEPTGTTPQTPSTPAAKPATTPQTPSTPAAKPATTPQTPSTPAAKPATTPTTPPATTRPRTTPSVTPKASKPTPPKVSKETKSVPSKPKKVETPPAPPVNPPKVGGTPTVPSVGVGILGAVSAQMSKAEAPHGPQGYVQANIPIGGKLNDPAHKIVKGNTDVTTGKKFDKDLTEMTIGEVVSLGKRRLNHFSKIDPKTGKSVPYVTSAMGKYQFVAKTLEGRAKAVFGNDWQNVPFSIENQDALNKSLIKENAQQLTKAGIPVSTASLYTMHFTGNTNLAKALMNSPNDMKMSDILSADQAKANPGIANMNVGEYKKHLMNKGYSFTPVDNRGLQSEPLFNTNTIGQSINSSSLENRDLNDSLSAPTVASNVINQNNINMIQKQSSVTPNEKYDDRSAYERKSRTV